MVINTTYTSVLWTVHNTSFCHHFIHLLVSTEKLHLLVGRGSKVWYRPRLRSTCRRFDTTYCVEGNFKPLLVGLLQDRGKCRRKPISGTYHCKHDHSSREWVVCMTMRCVTLDRDARSLLYYMPWQQNHWPVQYASHMVIKDLDFPAWKIYYHCMYVDDININ